MNERAKLVEILSKKIYPKEGVDSAEVVADYLLDNGVIVPPCKIGDTVYRVMDDKRITRPYEYKVIGFWRSADEICNEVHLVGYVNGVLDSYISVPFSLFNRMLFPTKEEAEKKHLRKERESNENTRRI